MFLNNDSCEIMLNIAEKERVSKTGELLLFHQHSEFFRNEN